jgi:GT2 family glycosyltransferase
VTTRATIVAAEQSESPALVDVVTVAYRSRNVLRGTVAPLVKSPDLHVIVVDNASPDDSLSAVADLPIEAIALPTNDGFAAGCNVGWRAGHAPYVLLLNPDARIEPASIAALREVLDREEGVGIVAPLIRNSSGEIEYSLRRFPRLRSRYAQALFLQRLFPNADWSDEVIRSPAAYEKRSTVEWVSGACMLIRRELLERLAGLDEDFFLYCEDIDLCKRVQDAGYDVVFEPSAVAVHIGGHSGPRPGFFPMLAESRLRYAKKHRRATTRVLERLGIGLAALTHTLLSTSIESRAGHARSLKAVVGGRAARP